MNLSDIDFDVNNAGNWPGPVKIIIVLLVCAAVLGGGYYLDTQHQIATLEKAEKKELGLKEAFKAKKAKAANLDKYKQQMVEMKQSFGAMLRQLPDKTEVAELLVDVSQSGLASGLEFELFQPKGEQRKGFYAELPIKLKVVGDYHEFGTFVSSLAALPRIVTIHDIQIMRRGKQGKGLLMDATARTYRYLEEGGNK